MLCSLGIAARPVLNPHVLGVSLCDISYAICNLQFAKPHINKVNVQNAVYELQDDFWAPSVAVVSGFPKMIQKLRYSHHHLV